MCCDNVIAKFISNRNSGSMFNPIFGSALDWDMFKSPVKERPIPMSYYHKALIISAIRKPNKSRDITYGDGCGFTLLGKKVKE